MKNKCVFVIGPESSGSTLIARICSHALGIQEFGTWHGNGCCENGVHKVCHRSLPYNLPPQYPDIKEWVRENKDEYDIYFVLSTRDINISESSRIERFLKKRDQVQIESKRAAEIMVSIVTGHQRYFIWSYETFMFLRKDYLNLLYEFIGLNSDFMPALVDGNRARISKSGLRTRPPTWIERKINKGIRSARKRIHRILNLTSVHDV